MFPFFAQVLFPKAEILNTTFENAVGAKIGELPAERAGKDLSLTSLSA
jgi:hypothetical protein